MQGRSDKKHVACWGPGASHKKFPFVTESRRRLGKQRPINGPASAQVLDTRSTITAFPSEKVDVLDALVRAKGRGENEVVFTVRGGGGSRQYEPRRHRVLAEYAGGVYKPKQGEAGEAAFKDPLSGRG